MSYNLKSLFSLGKYIFPLILPSSVNLTHWKLTDYLSWPGMWLKHIPWCQYDRLIVILFPALNFLNLWEEIFLFFTTFKIKFLPVQILGMQPTFIHSAVLANMFLLLIPSTLYNVEFLMLRNMNMNALFVKVIHRSFTCLLSTDWIEWLHPQCFMPLPLHTSTTSEMNYSIVYFLVNLIFSIMGLKSITSLAFMNGIRCCHQKLLQ